MKKIKLLLPLLLFALMSSSVLRAQSPAQSPEHPPQFGIWTYVVAADLKPEEKTVLNWGQPNYYVNDLFTDRERVIPAGDFFNRLARAESNRALIRSLKGVTELDSKMSLAIGTEVFNGTGLELFDGMRISVTPVMPVYNADGKVSKVALNYAVDYAIPYKDADGSTVSRPSQIASTITVPIGSAYLLGGTKNHAQNRDILVFAIVKNLS